MTYSGKEDWQPASEEETCCPLCESDEGIVVGTVGRNDTPVRNVSCVTCGTVYMTPRPDREQMAEFYRIHYRSSGHVARKTTGVEMDADLRKRGQRQAQGAIQIGRTQPGDSVLEIGCHLGQTLLAMNEMLGIDAHGIEPGEAEAEFARGLGINTHVGVLETYDPGEQKFDQIQMFHVLEHVHDPLACLIRLRSMLKPGGRVIIEVPDMLKPHGILEWFFQLPHLYSFSRSNLMGLFRRAGLEPYSANEGQFTGLAGRKKEGVGPLPLPYVSTMHPEPQQSGAWVAERLITFNALEKIRIAVVQGADVPMEQVCRLVRRQGLPVKKVTGTSHTEDVVGQLIQILVKRRQFFQVADLLEATTKGPHEPRFIQQCSAMLEQTRVNLQKLRAS